MLKIPGCKLFLGDRPIQITIARAFQSLSVYELGQVLYHLTSTKPKPLEWVHFVYLPIIFIKYLHSLFLHVVLFCTELYYFSDVAKIS